MRSPQTTFKSITFLCLHCLLYWRRLSWSTCTFGHQTQFGRVVTWPDWLVITETTRKAKLATHMTLGFPMDRNYVNQSDSDKDVDVVVPGCWAPHEIASNCTTIIWASTITGEPAASNWSSSLRDGELYMHPHWLQYRDVIDEAPAWFMYLVGVYMTVICFTGIVGNITVIVVFLGWAMVYAIDDGSTMSCMFRTYYAHIMLIAWN